MFLTKSRFDHALTIAGIDAVTNERKRVEESRRITEVYNLEQFVGNLVIILSNEVTNLTVAYAKEITYITQANSPVLVVVDLVTKEEKLVFGKTFMYTKQKFDALNSLDPNSRLSLFYYPERAETIEQKPLEVIQTPEEWSKTVNLAIKNWFSENEISL